MMSRLTCLLIFTLLLASPANVFADDSSSSTTEDPTTEATTQPTDPPTTPPLKVKEEMCPDNQKNVGECPKGSCTSGVCYRDMMGNDGKTTQRCCPNLGDFCKEKLFVMHAHNRQSKYDTYQYKYTAQTPSKPDLWYKHENPASGPEGVACPVPNSFTMRVEDKRYVPVGWVEDKKLTQCDKNTACGEGEFCDAVWNPSFLVYGDENGLDGSGADGKSLRFCYKLPPIESNMKHVEHENGLKICNKQTDCGSEDQICHIVDKITYKNESNPGTTAAGVCVHVDACDGRASLRAVLNVNSQMCTDDSSCENAGMAKGSQDFNPHCTSYYPAEPSRKLCCFEKNPVCRVGKAVTPFKKCTKMSDCTGDVLVKDAQWNTWCDDGGLNMCCKDHENKKWQCPDLITPLFNEPKCSGSTNDNIHSGTCPKKGGRCVHGHCCPPLTISENGTKVVLGRNLYETEFPCNPEAPVPTGFSYVFCNSETKKLIVVGKFHNNGDSMTKVSGSKCTLNSDCSKDGSAVCVYENDKNHICYYNPLRALRPQVSSFWKTMLIVSLICAAIFLVTSLICFVCYRSKSVFDKYKPKKKGKKGKGSDSKSSKGSKNKKKGGKKGGKKGKKGEESSTSKSSKSKKSKTKSKKETEKSEAGTTGDGTTSSQIN